ncbi:MAG: hypothetical protein ACRD3Q_17310 [Terriglobales bacterium]
MTITTTVGATIGTSTLTITGACGSLTHTAQVGLTLNPVPDFSITALPGSQTITVGNSATYTVSTTALNGFAGAIALSVSGLPSGATASFAADSINGSGSSTLTIATAPSLLAKGYTLTLTGTSGALLRTAQISLIVNPAAGSSPPTVNGSSFVPIGTQNLTSLGTSDWIHWGLNSTSPDRKTGGSHQISDFTVIGTGSDVITHSDYPLGFSWSDGNPTSSATATPTGVYIRGQNLGFSFTVPADTTRRLLILYVGLFNAGMQIRAHLSDGSSPDYVDNYAGVGSPAREYTLVYSAASSNQTLTITYVQTAIYGANNNITLEAAALSTIAPGADFVTVLNPPVQSVAPGNAASYQVTVAPQAGFGDTVSFSVAGLPPNTSAVFDPPAVTASGSALMTITSTAAASPGAYSLSISAAGSSGLSHSVAGVFNLVGGSGAYLGGASFVPSYPANLTSARTMDWAFWGLQSVSTFDHKAGVTSQIQNFSLVNAQPGQAFSYASPWIFGWSDGTPDLNEPQTTGAVAINGLNTGFQIVLPADTSQRTIVLYAGLYNTAGKLVAQLSDGSAPDYIDTTFADSATIPAAYIITYKAGSAGQSLTLRWTMNSTSGPRCAEMSGVHCFVTLQAATLTEP